RRRHPHGQAGDNLARPSGQGARAFRPPAGRLPGKRRGSHDRGRGRAWVGRPQKRDPRVAHRHLASGSRDHDHLLRRRRGCLAARVIERRYVHALALGLEPAWRRLDRDERCRSAEQFAAAATAPSEVSTFTYSMVGLKTGVDLLLWSLAPSLEALEEKSARALRAGMGSWMLVRHSFVGLIAASQYVKRPTSQEQSLFSGERSRYLIVY